MKVIIPTPLLITAQEFSKFKTPTKRTAGFSEQEGQKRGVGDLVDTVASMMLTHYLGSHNIPCKYQLALWQGDTFDIEVNTSVTRTINVKGSTWQPRIDDFGKVNYHMAIKKSEFHKLNNIFSQVMVHLNPDDDKPHLHFCGWFDTSSLPSDPEKSEYFGEIPNTGGSKGLWIPSSDLRPFSEFLDGIK
jgi:hypothetical protein